MLTMKLQMNKNVLSLIKIIKYDVNNIKLDIAILTRPI